MSKIINHALRTLTAFAFPIPHRRPPAAVSRQAISGGGGETFAGVLAAVAAFALLNLPTDQPADAAQQRDSNRDLSTVAVTSALDAITLTVSNADLDAGDFLFFDIPGYRALNTVQTIDDPDSSDPADRIPDPQRACVVAITSGRYAHVTNYLGGAPAGSAYACKTKSDGTGIFGWAEISNAANVHDYLLDITDVATTNASASIGHLTLRESGVANAVDRTTDLPGTASLIGIGYNNTATPPSPGIPFRLLGAAPDSITVSSTTASAPVQIEATIQLSTTLAEGSAIVLYLENDYVMPGPIRARYVWFTVSGTPASGNPGDRQASAGRHYPTGHPPGYIQIFGDDWFDGSAGTAIRVYIPDLFVGDTPGVSQGFQVPVAGETLTLTIHQDAGIRNHSEAGSHSLGYSILGPGADIPRTPQHRLPDARTFAKINLSSDSGAPGQVVTVIGSGFNNGVSAALYMLHYANDSNGNPTAGRWIAPAADAAPGTRGTLSQHGDPNAAIADAGAVQRHQQLNRYTLNDSTLAVGDVMTPAETCADIIAYGTELVHNYPTNPYQVVGRDDRVTIEFTVANPPFRPGNKNLLCMADGEGRTSSTDVEHFTLLPPLPVASNDSDDDDDDNDGGVAQVNLDPSIRVEPDAINAGDSVTVLAEGFPAGAVLRWLEVFGERIDPDSANPLGNNGKGSLTFAMPGKWKGVGKVAVCYAAPDAASCHQANARITVAPAQLNLSHVEVRPNETITVRGLGFSKTPGATLSSARIGNVDLLLVSHGGNLANVEVADRQFVATFAIWPTDPADDNPALLDGVHEIEITDQEGFSGTAQVTILTPTLAITPAVAGPGGSVTITGANWPATNRDGGAVSPVHLEITGGNIDAEITKAATDANGNWSLRYRVPGKISLPATMSVRASYGEQPVDILAIANFSVPAASLSLTPDRVGPGAVLTLNAAGFARRTRNITVKIGDVAVAVPTNAATDGEGRIKNLAVNVPALDAGAYTVRLNVGGTVAVGAITVPEGYALGESDLAGALAPLGDNLVRVWHFNNLAKTWSFYDPHPEFAELNTLTTLSQGQSYWILLEDDMENVLLNASARTFACLEGSCWNNMVW